MTTENTNGQLLPFARSAEELRELALRHMDTSEPLTALELLRLSLEKAPRDHETLLLLAETYASIDCWVLSNRAYFSIAHDEDAAARSFYGMGCNFYAMQIYSAARDCFMLALQKEPEADFAPEAIDLIDIIEEASYTPGPAELLIQRRMERVLDAMDRGNARLASRQVRRVLPLGGQNHGIHSLEAFALLAAGDAAGSLQAARKALRADPEDIRAHCAMASALKAENSMEAANVYLMRAAERIESEDDRQLVCQTACDMGEHTFVVAMLSMAEKRMPYADDVLHPLAVALYNSGQHDEAIRRWRLLRRIDPMDSVATYRLRHAEEKTLPAEIPYGRQVPLSETLARLDRLRGWVHEGRDALLVQWRADDALESTLRWGLASDEEGIPKATCNIISTIEDEGAQVLLRDVLCDMSATAALKQSALASLYSMRAPEPYYAFMEDRLTLVHVSRSADDGEGDRATREEAIWALAKDLAPIDENMEENAGACDLCKRAAAVDCALDNTMRARAVVIALCRMAHIPDPFSSTFFQRRKVERLARHIMKGAEHEAD